MRTRHSPLHWTKEQLPAFAVPVGVPIEQDHISYEAEIVPFEDEQMESVIFEPVQE